jgi:hypothetical protein
MQIPEGSEAGSGWKEMQIPEGKEADSKVKWTLVPEGKGCRFQRESDVGSRRKGVQVPAQKTSESSCIFRNCKRPGNLSFGVFHTERCGMLYKCSVFWGKKFAKEETPPHSTCPPPPPKPIFIPTSGPLCCWPKNVKSDDMKRKKLCEKIPKKSI